MCQTQGRWIGAFALIDSFKFHVILFDEPDRNLFHHTCIADGSLECQKFNGKTAQFFLDGENIDHIYPFLQEVKVSLTA